MIRRKCKCGCGGITNLGKKWICGHNGKGNKGYKHTKETKLKMSLLKFKSHPNDQYCDEWRDREYKKDLRKDYCENADCKGTYKRLGNHHINLNKKNCRPSNVMTLCYPCHVSLHRQLELGKIKVTNPQDFITIIRKDHITYIHKRTRKKVIVKRIKK